MPYRVWRNGVGTSHALNVHKLSLALTQNKINTLGLNMVLKQREEEEMTLWTKWMPAENCVICKFCVSFKGV